MSVGCGGQRIFKGVSGIGYAGNAIGRIAFFRSGRESRTGEMLCLFERGTRECEIVESLCRALPAGVIVSAAAISGGVIDLLVCKGIPYLIVKDAFPEDLRGRVALLDGEADRVIVDPDVESLNFFSLSGCASRLLSVRESDRRDIRIAQRKGGGGAVVYNSGARGEELFENLRDIAENRCTESITVSLRVPRGEGEKEAFLQDCEAVLRAAVYGDLSLELRGYVSARGLREAFDVQCKAFCRLEVEGKEFNGFLKRGILIDTPIWLMQEMPLPNADFICYDFDAITARMMGIEQRELADTELPGEAIMRLWEQYFCSFAPRMPMRATSGVLAQHPIFEEWAERAGIDEIYLP